MQIGEYKIHSVQTGLFRLDGGAMFGIVPKPLWSKTNPADENNRIDMCMRAMLLVSDKKKILIDNGIGYKNSEKFNTIYGINHSYYTLENELKKLGYTPEDITDVILTHLHFDHAGGSTYKNENGETKITFPNAVHYIQRRHLDWAMNPSDRDKASFIPGDFEPLEKAGLFRLIDDDYFFDENIKLNVVNGHTPAQQIVTIRDDNSILLYAGDLFPMASHVHLPYIMGYDLFPLTTLNEKKIYLSKIVREKWIVFFEHDPYTETARIHRTEKGYSIIKEEEWVSS
jgi:glyoxylase-like metal-dependent hydrolase (beta-lactamase superfamily II)